MKYFIHIAIIFSVFYAQFAVSTDINCMSHETDNSTAHSHTESHSHAHETAPSHSQHDRHTPDEHQGGHHCCSAGIVFIKSSVNPPQLAAYSLTPYFSPLNFLPDSMQYAPLIRPSIYI